MKISHIGIWTNQIEVLRDFYIKYFDAICSEKYYNEGKKFQSYFLSFGETTKLELMNTPSVTSHSSENSIGLAHIAFNVGSVEYVDQLTNLLKKDGYHVASNPRMTGDGYYESVILDPDNNHIEITC